MFFIAAGIYFFGLIFYTLFSSADIQPWAQDNASSKEHAKNNQVVPADNI